MNDNSWQRAKEIFDEARRLAPDLRAAFIDTECEGDEKLRAEVEMLLSSYKSDFLEDNVIGAANLLIEPDLTNGQVIGRYTIGELIGTGGMGQVFRADDTELNRPVAFKVLHRDVADDQERVRRFIQEARAASALNHPNILTIYEIGSFEDARFIVSEFVDGETLRERMAKGLTPAESLDITCQIAAALQAAHAAGIVHRDIKPENIMLRQDGLVKVLDFGLAKLVEGGHGDAETPRHGDEESPLIAASPRPGVPPSTNTMPGLIMGTVAYMSPEQARGQTVDSRTDLWSLGVVFHEMLTGESPFKGESVTDLVTSIIKHDPDSLDLKSISQELKPICTKVLAKDKLSRYQTAQDLLQDLLGEKKRMEYAIQPTPYITVSSTDELKTQLIRRRPTLSAEYLVTSVKRHKYATLSTVVAVVAFGVGLSVYRNNSAIGPDPEVSDGAVITGNTTENDLKMSKFAVSGLMREAVISPDGKYVAYILENGPTKQSIRLRVLESGKEAELVKAPEVGRLQNISFTDDLTSIYYVLNTPNNEEIFRISVSGGTAAKITENTDGGGSLSPDGKLFAFQRDPKGETIYVANPDGSGERILLDRPGDDWVYCGSVPVWSPDSKWLACSEHFKTKDGEGYKLVLLNAGNGEVKTIGEQKWLSISGFAFMPDGSITISAREAAGEAMAPSQLWRVDPKGEATRITNDLTGFGTLSATKKGDVILTMQEKLNGDLWSMPIGDVSRSRRITSSGEVVAGFSYTPADKFVIISNTSGNMDMWLMDNDGGNRSQLTANRGQHTAPFVSPDGRYLVYENAVDFFGTHIFRADADGKNPVRLTNGLREWTPRFSPDGKWVYYVQVHGDKPQEVRRISINGGEPTIIATGGRNTRVQIRDVNQKDGRIAVEFTQMGQPKPKRTITLISPTGRQTTLELPQTAMAAAGPTPAFVAWTPDNKNLAFIGRTESASTITSVPANGKGGAKTLLTLPDRIRVFRFSPDGKSLAYVKETLTRDAVVITKKGN